MPAARLMEGRVLTLQSLQGSGFLAGKAMADFGLDGGNAPLRSKAHEIAGGRRLFSEPFGGKGNPPGSSLFQVVDISL